MIFELTLFKSLEFTSKSPRILILGALVNFLLLNEFYLHSLNLILLQIGEFKLLLTSSFELEETSHF